VSLNRAITELAGLKARLAKAEIERDTWRAAHRQENYLEACSMVDALEMQIAEAEGAARAAAASAPTTASPTHGSTARAPSATSAWTTARCSSAFRCRARPRLC